MSLRVYYRIEMVAEGATRFSPSASKPAEVIADWGAAGVDMEVKKPWPVSATDLCRTHDPAYVAGVLDGSLANGFGDTGDDVRRALPFTVGAMVCATKYALKTGQNAAALCSGFHHASYATGGGFCTFNGLVVAAQAAKAAGARRVGILDLDHHYGNGTDQIVKRLKLDFVEHFTAGLTFKRADQARGFLDGLPALIKKRFYNCNVLIYQAGADPFVEDPLGGWLTMDELRERDRLVFNTCARMRLPVAWNLAGGYAKEPDGSIPKVLAIHRATAEESLGATAAKAARKKSA